MKILSSFLIYLFILGNSSFAQNKVQQTLTSFAQKDALTHAGISFKAVDLSNGATVATHQPSLGLPTASTAKLFSTATALEILGESYRPTTRIYHDGFIDSTGRLVGNIWIRGGGDPSLGSKYFTTKEHKRDFLIDWVNQLKRMGIASIEGNIIADASEFGYEGAPNGWSWVDMGNYYGAGPSGLTIFDNLVSYTFSTPETYGKTSTLKGVEPEVPGLVFHNYVQSSSRRGDNAYIYGAPYSLDRFASGTLPAGKSSFIVKGSLPDPEFQFAYELHKLFLEHNITVNGELKTGRSMELSSKSADYEKRTLLITHKGASIGQLINKTNERSINLFAEHLICLVGYKKTGKGSIQNGLSVLENYWSSKFNTTGLHVNDGSGLSRSNAISAVHFTDMLSSMHNGKNGERFMASLPIAGKSGTLRSICKGQAGHGRVFAKSGSMSRIRSYAGYVQSSSGKKYAFAIIVNNASCSSRQLIKLMEPIFNALATY